MYDSNNFLLCPIYSEPVLPDEDDLCSLCGQHSASATVNTHWATLEELKMIKELPL